MVLTPGPMGFQWKCCQAFRFLKVVGGWGIQPKVVYSHGSCMETPLFVRLLSEAGAPSLVDFLAELLPVPLKQPTQDIARRKLWCPLSPSLRQTWHDLHHNLLVRRSTMTIRKGNTQKLKSRSQGSPVTLNLDTMMDLLFLLLLLLSSLIAL